MVSIIILSYNTKDLLLACLGSLTSSLKAEHFEIIVVDNNSADDSVQAIRKSFPHVHLVKNNENVGFARGANIGSKHANGNLLLFLNSDTKMMSGSFFAVEQLFSQDTHIGVIGGKLEMKNGRAEHSGMG